MSLLDVRDLAVSFESADGIVRAVRGVSFSVEAGKTLGIVGESGSGKSVATQSMVRLTRGARVTGEVRFDGRDLLRLSADELRAIRGAEIGMIFQDPLSSLHPYYTVGWQIEEMLRAHRDISRDDARKRAIELLGAVGIPRASERVDQFPHQFSGGMRQRAMIAMAIALDPKLLIADEPTTALDVTVQAQIIALLERLQRDTGTAIIMITHDLGVIAEMADDVVVMYAGRVMERAPARTLFHFPHHPYTVGLIGSIPRGTAAERPLVAIPGQPPSPLSPPSGCPFHPRCPFVMPKCVTDTPPLRPVREGTRDAHGSACWLPLDLVGTSDEVQRERAQFADAARLETVP